MCKVNILHFIEGAKQAEGLTVIIDVFRAFSLECYLYEMGVKEIRPVGSVEDAFGLHKEFPGSVLIGERHGKKCDGFDFGNSPSTVLQSAVTGRTILHTTSAGTQGIVNAVNATEIITGSLVNAKAVAEYIKQKQPETVSLVCMGNEGVRPAAEDELCAEYIKSMVEGVELPDFAKRVENLQFQGGAHFFDKERQEIYPEEDFRMCVKYDKFPFVIHVEKDEAGFVTRREFVLEDTMILPDYHIHTSFSPDSKMDQEEAVCAARVSGVTHLCFTEHMDLGHHMEMYNSMPDFKGMDDTVSRFREKYLGIHIGKGIEAGYIPETAEQTARVLSEQSFDYVLLSTHCVDGMDCGVPESKRGQDKETAYRRYLEAVYTSVTDERLTPYYDCVGHIGYIAKGLHYEDNTFSYDLFPELFDKILCEIIKRGKGIEVNTSGIDRGGHVFPHPSIIRRYKELGGSMITIGSDAHKSQNVGAYIKDAVEIIKRAGFEEITLFQNREPRFVKIV